jgi:glycerol-3-phosphate dehydrogenase (NAD(P)+)
MKITVFGSGGWGTAVAKLLSENGHTVTMWSKFDEEAELLDKKRENPLLTGVAIPGTITITSSLKQAATAATLPLSRRPPSRWPRQRSTSKAG